MRSHPFPLDTPASPGNADHSHCAKKNPAWTPGLTLGNSSDLHTSLLAPSASLSFHSVLTLVNDAWTKLSILPCLENQIPVKEAGRVVCHDLPCERNPLSHFPLISITVMSFFPSIFRATNACEMRDFQTIFQLAFVFAVV